jgi:hypothetical protein
MNSFIRALLAFVAAASISLPSAGQGSSAGQFVMAGPTNAIADELSMRWQYGFKLELDQSEIADIAFTCDPIPGTVFSAKASDLKRAKDGAYFISGPTLLVSKESTPWLFDSSTTSATCKATIRKSDQSQAVISAPVSFGGQQKAATLQQLRMAHDFNRPVKK